MSQTAARDPAHSGSAPASEPTVLVVGTPNSGKSTLFNGLTGARAHVSNFAGTTVTRTEARLQLEEVGSARVVDLPGTYSLAARSPEERVAIDAILGLTRLSSPDLLVVVGDAPRLHRSLYLVLQLLELEIPLVLALNLMDEARAQGTAPDVEALTGLLGVPVVPIVARSGEGITELRAAVTDALTGTASHPGCPHDWSDALKRDAAEIAEAFPAELRDRIAGSESRERAFALWLLLSADWEGAVPELEGGARQRVAAIVARAAAEGRDIQAELVGTRYAWIDAHAAQWTPEGSAVRGRPVSDRVDEVLLHPAWGSVVFLSVMALVFTALFAWADPAIGAIESLFGVIGGAVAAGFAAAIEALPALAGPLGFLGDLAVEGIIGGVGAVLVFLPQIGLLFLFIALLEDCGYLARAAHLMDRVLRIAGLPGQAFVPLLSGYACAVPAIMATRTMPRFRDRLLTMMVVPLTSCSARLPVYTLVIAAIFPATIAGMALPVRPTALFAMYLFSTGLTVLASIALGRLVLRGEADSALLELPPYRWPGLRTVVRTVIARCGDFIREAGRIILLATVVLWGLLSFPAYTPEDVLSAEVIAQAQADGDDVEALAAPVALERSYAGRIGKAIEPVIRPLGYDWKIGIGLIGSFAAREVFVSTMGLVYGIGDEVDETSPVLRERMRAEVRSDGRPVYSPLVGVSLMVFFAVAMQCLSTLAVLRKETGGWRWPAFIFTYMTVLAWVLAFAVYQGGRALGFG